MDKYGSFRPLTGIMVLIDFLEFAIQLFFQVFPSPYGDYGSYRQNVLFVSILVITFPSPYGDYGSYQFKEKR